MTDASKGLRLYNTLTRSKEDFVPIDPGNIRLYVCGPTVYDYAHIGNARPAIVFDVLFRLLRHLYGAEHVTYVRNITDVDDKINARALRDFGAEIDAGRLSLNEAIRKVTEPTYDQYQKDVTALGCLPPTHQPRATEFVLPRSDGKADMVTLIQSLIDRGHAYEAQGEILFDTASMADYGQLSKRNLDEQQAGARIAVDAHKKNPGDFILWKQSSVEEPGWDASFALTNGSRKSIRGRPGWHIECSAMSAAYLGEVFDIHGGGLDLIFPHHENEIAQSRCAHGTSVMANYWMHNGFLQVEGRKMSKSEGNFATIHELLDTEKFGERSWSGEVLRLVMLKTHYRQPIDWTIASLREAEQELSGWALTLNNTNGMLDSLGRYLREESAVPNEEVVAALSDDLNTSAALTAIRSLHMRARKGDQEACFELTETLRFMGLLRPDRMHGYNRSHLRIGAKMIPADLAPRLDEFQTAYLNRSILRQDAIKTELRQKSVVVQISEAGLVSYEVAEGADQAPEDDELEDKIARRLALIAAKNWAEADKIRDELLAQGIQLKDGKDPATGERITTWEVKR